MRAEERILYKGGLEATGEPTPEEIAYARHHLLNGGYGERILSELAGSGLSATAVLDALRRGLNLSGAGVAPGFFGTRVEDEAHDYAVDRDGIVALFGSEPERWHWNAVWSGWSHEKDRILVPRLMYLLEDVPLEKIRVARVRLADLAREAVGRHAQPSLLEMV